MTFWDWMLKAWYLKLIDIVLITALFAGIVAVFSTTLLFFSRQGKKAQISNDKGKWSFTLIDEFGKEKEVSRDELGPLLDAKEKEIQNLRIELLELSERFKILENTLREKEVILEYKKDHYVPMLQHAVFFNLKRGMSGVKIPYSGTLGMKLKAEVAEAFLSKCKMKVFYEGLYGFVQEIEQCKTDYEANEQLYTVLDKVMFWISEYNTLASKTHVELSNGKVLKSIPEIFLTEFNKWHDSKVEIVAKKIRDTLYSEFYGSWQLKLIVILDHIDVAFYLTIIDAQKTILELNGTMEKLLLDL